jgi:hypothetical protein
VGKSSQGLGAVPRGAVPAHAVRSARSPIGERTEVLLTCESGFGASGRAGCKSDRRRHVNAESPQPESVQKRGGDAIFLSPGRLALVEEDRIVEIMCARWRRPLGLFSVSRIGRGPVASGWG